MYALLYKFVCTFVGQPNEEKIIILKSRRDKHIFDDFTPENLEKRFGGTADDLIYGEGDCLFPPRVPSENVFFPWEDKNKILISEEEYINKCRNGDIPIESMSPFIQEKLIEEERNKKKIIEENKKENSNKKNKINIINLNHANINKNIPIHPVIINNNNISTNINNFNITNRRNKIYEINQFLKSADWQIKEEFNDKNIFKSLRKNNFINNIKSFVEKRERFTKSITKLK